MDEYVDPHEIHASYSFESPLTANSVARFKAFTSWLIIKMSKLVERNLI